MFPKKQKTFHAPVPVCSGCKAVTEKSISCTKCRQICCVTCLGLSGEVFNSYQEEMLVTLLANRTCMRCKTGSAQPLPGFDGELNPPIEIEAQNQVAEPVVTVPDDRGKCADHGKVRKLFCLTCSQLLCGDCFGSGEDHVQHIINNVDILYQEKLDEIERKLQQVTAEVRIMEEEARVCRQQLVMIEERKQTVLGEVGRVSSHSKAEVERLTAGRITALRGQVDRADQRQRDLTALRETVQQLHPEDFLKQCQDIRRQCDELLANSTANGCTPAQTEDIGCELVSPFELVSFKLPNFSGTTMWPLSLVTKFDVWWDGRVQKGENVTVQLWPRDPKFNDFKYEVLVVVTHHQDISKEVLKTFDHGNEETLFSVHQCVQEGFVGSENELTIKVGVRSSNALIAYKLLEKQYGTVKTKLNDVENQLHALKNSFDYKFQTMWFVPFEPSMMAPYNIAQMSCALVDRAGRSWCLYVKTPFLHPEPSNVEAHVALAVGTPTWCRYFIELEHQTDRTKNIRKSGTSWFGATARIGWNNFISKQALQADLGYRASGNLNFCFGVQPQAAGFPGPEVQPAPGCPIFMFPVRL